MTGAWAEVPWADTSAWVRLHADGTVAAKVWPPSSVPRGTFFWAAFREGPGPDRHLDDGYAPTAELARKAADRALSDHVGRG